MITLPANNASAKAERGEPAMHSGERREAEDRTSRAQDWLVRLEWLTVTLVALCAIALHVHFITSVGGLWRDETNSVNLGTLSSFGQIWSLLEYDSFPIVFVTVLRLWTAAFGSGNDTALRALGLLIGLGVLGVLFRNARSLGARAPVLSLALIGLNPMVIRYGDSVRAYGLGILLILMTLGTFWRLVSMAPSPPLRRILAATVLALLSVHCLFYNSVLLFAIAAGVLTVTIRSRAWRTAGIVLGIGAISGSSLLVYSPMMTRKQDWTFMVSYPADLAWLWKRTCEVIGSPDPLSIWLWLGLFVAGLSVVACFAVSQLPREFAGRPIMGSYSAMPLSSCGPQPLPDAVIFAAVALIIGVVGYAAFLRMLHYYTQPWYYITLVAFAACALDVVFGAWPIAASRQVLPLLLRAVRLVVAIALLCFTGLLGWEQMPVRHTNVDLLAARLRPLATDGDVILVPRWECAIPLVRYYRGSADVVTLPPIADHRLHRYDLVVGQMMALDPMRTVIERTGRTLQLGHRVFLVGALPAPETSDFPLDLPPAYRDAKGELRGGPYATVWSLQVSRFLAAHAKRISEIKVTVPGDAPVQDFEKLDLFVVEGWR